MTGTWVLYLPHIKSKFGLNDAEIGLALFCLAVGLLISIPFIPYMNKKYGVGQSTKAGILIYASLFNLPLAVPSYVALCGSLLVIGIFSGFTDISMNALVSTIETKEKKPFMAAAHGFFSLGGFIGAGIGSVLIVLFDHPIWHMFSVSMFIILSNFFLAKYYSPIKEKVIAEEHKPKHTFKNIQTLFGLAMVGFIIMFNEGAVEHWSNLFLFDIVKVTESQAGLGFIAFSLCMTLGRFLGDNLSQKYGTINIICYGSLTAFVAYFSILTANLIFTVAGFGLLGLGLSVIIPEVFRLAGQTKGIPASTGISIVSGIGFVGFMIGPVLLGFISNWTSLTSSFHFLSLSIIIALGLAFFNLKITYIE